LALPASAEFYTRWLSAAPNEYRPVFFGPEDFEALESITEILIPTDETPGAKDARCAQFIDFVLDASTGYAPETQTRWRVAMSALEKAGFHKADRRGREELVEAMSAPERDPSRWHPAFAAYRLIKRENTFAFYTAHAGIIESLDYRGNTYNPVFPACQHPEHHVV
jgi:hypothetical protein